MTVHRRLPSEIEPEALDDLIADCAALPTQARPAGARAVLPRPGWAGPVRFPPEIIAIADGYEGHG